MNWRAKALADSGDKLYAEVAKSHAKRNCLVIGPAGSGKLSLVRGLAALTNSRARKFLFDWQAELPAQMGLLDDFAVRVQDVTQESQVWLHRNIHRLPQGELDRFYHLNFELIGKNTLSVLSYATAEREICEWQYFRELEHVFPVRVELGSGGYGHGALESVLKCAMTSLRQKYGKGIGSIEPDAAEELEGIASRSRMQTMLSVLERAYVLETDSTLHASTLKL